MKQGRQEDLSLHHFIRNSALSDFIETEYNVPLVYSTDLSTTGSHVYNVSSVMAPPPTSFGRGWVYTDDYSTYTEQSNSVTVYDSGDSVISGSLYNIDYIDGRIIFPDRNTIPANVTYKWYYVSIVNEWEQVEAAAVPVVVVDLVSFTKEGFQLGGGRFVPRKISIQVFASDQGERDDLMEALYDGLNLKCCALQTFSNGTMLDWDGRWNDSYSYATVSGSSFLKFDNVESRNIYPRLIRLPDQDLMQLSDLNRYRSRITLDMVHWEEA